MKVAICFVLLFAAVVAGPGNPTGHIELREFDPEYKRYIHIENADGQIELVDLLEGEIDAFVATSDVSYDFYSRTTQNSPVSITNNDVSILDRTNFDSKKETLFVAHGWNNNRNSEVNTKIRSTVFVNHDINLFIVDWSGPANKNYISAKGATVDVGKIIGAFVSSIQSKYGIDGSSFTLSGHSLGAHVAGNAGAATNRQVEHIIGLDPAGPLYSLSSTNDRLDPSDGKFVQVIHTNGNLLGLSSSIGDADYYPNGGNSQPGCGLDLIGTCAHSRAYEFFGEALSRGEVFNGHLCGSYSQFQNGACSNNAKSVMGTIILKSKNGGDYYLSTNSNSPYGQS